MPETTTPTPYQRNVRNYYRYLNWMRRQQDLNLTGQAWDGSYEGDGIPRDLSGKEYEPLSWPGISRTA